MAEAASILSAPALGDGRYDGNPHLADPTWVSFHVCAYPIATLQDGEAHGACRADSLSNPKLRANSRAYDGEREAHLFN